MGARGSIWPHLVETAGEDAGPEAAGAALGDETRWRKLTTPGLCDCHLPKEYLKDKRRTVTRQLLIYASLYLLKKD